MDLPKEKFKKQKGQVLVIFLLIVVMSLAIVLSVASRTITDIRTTSTTDESNRAYFAAESGVEEALQRIATSGGVVPQISTNISNAEAETTTREYRPTSGNFGDFVYPENLEKDSTAQIVLSYNPASTPFTGTLLHVYFGSEVNPQQAIEVSVIFQNTTNLSYGIKKFAFDVTSGRGNHFCTAHTFGYPVSDGIGIAKKYFYYGQIFIKPTPSGGYPPSTITDPVLGCDDTWHDSQLANNESPMLLRIRALYNVAPIPIGLNLGSGSLPSQGTLVESVGHTTSGVTRKIQAVQLARSLPALFDYVLFTNGDLAK